VTLSKTLLAFRSNWVYHYIYFRFYVAGLDVASTRLWFCDYQQWMPMKQRYKLHRCDVSWILAFDSGKMTMQEYKQRYFYIFKMTDKTGNSNMSSSRAHSRSTQPNKSEVSITEYYREKTSLRPHQTQRVSTNKCVIDRQPEIAVWPCKPEVLISATVWQISL